MWRTRWRTDQVGRRLALLRRAIEIGPTYAFFEAAEREDLPFPLMQAGPDAPPAGAAAAGLLPLIQQAVSTGNTGDMVADPTALRTAIDAWEKVVSAPSFADSPRYMRRAPATTWPFSGSGSTP